MSIEAVRDEREKKREKEREVLPGATGVLVRSYVYCHWKWWTRIEFVLRLCTAGRAGVYCVRGKLLEKAA